MAGVVQVLSFSDLGVTVRLAGGFRGLIYAEELDFQSAGSGIRVGDSVTLYVQKVREDGKVDVAFRKYGFFPKLKDARQVLLDALSKAPNGMLPLGDRSDPGVILSTLGISKSQFKAAVGSLYKARLLAPPEDEKIRLATAGGEDDEEEEEEEGDGEVEVLESWGKSKTRPGANLRRGGDDEEEEGGGWVGAVLLLLLLLLLVLLSSR